MPYQTVISPCCTCKKESCKSCVFRVYANREPNAAPLSDGLVENLWRECEDIAFTENEDGELVLDQKWRGFPPGEFTQYDWFHWVDEHHSKGVVWVYENISPWDFNAR